MTIKRVHAFTDDVLADHDAVALAALLRKKELSPVEVTEAAIARSERIHQSLNAMSLPLYHTAKLNAEKPLQGVLGGVPTLIKDNTHMRGVPTKQGSRAVSPRAENATGAFAKQFLSLGVNVVGKSALPEFGFNATTEFAEDAPTLNPWNPKFSSGASSGGAAVLVAAGAVPIAHANDGGGSIRIPAACCGLVGLKSTRGRLVDSAETRSLPLNIISEGVVTRTVRDTATFFYGAERYFHNQKLPKIGLVEGPAKRRLRIGMVVDSITGHATCPQTRAAVEQTALVLQRLGHTVEEVPLPVTESFAGDFQFYWSMLSFFVGTFGKRLFGPSFDASQMDGLSSGLASSFKKQFIKTPFVLRRLKRTAHDYANFFQNVDLVLSPVLAHTTPELGYLNPSVPYDELMDRLMRYVSFTPLNNASGGPAISLPMGVTSNDLPIGVQFSAAHGDERTLLEVAFELEQANPWRRIQDIA